MRRIASRLRPSACIPGSVRSAPRAPRCSSRCGRERRGGGKQATGLVGTDVAHRHPGSLGQLAGSSSRPRRVCSFPHGKRETLPVHLFDGSEQRKAIAAAMSSAGVKVGKVLAGALLTHPLGEDRVDDDDVGGGAGAFEAVGEGQRPRLGRGLGRCVGGVGVRRRLRLLGGDEDEATVLLASRASWKARVVCWTVRISEVVEDVPIGERRLAQRLSPTPATDQVQSASTRPKRSSSAAHQARVASSSSRSTARPSQRSVGSPSSAPTSSTRSGEMSVPAIAAPASASRSATTGPSPPATPAIATTRPLSWLISRKLPRQEVARCVPARPGRRHRSSQEVDRRSGGLLRCRPAAAASLAAFG